MAMTMQQTSGWVTPAFAAPAESEFCEAALAEGFLPHVSGVSDFGASCSSGRSGDIVVRGRRRRELVLVEAGRTALSAYLDDFAPAAEAVLQWLERSSIRDRVQLVSLSGKEVA